VDLLANTAARSVTDADPVDREGLVLGE